MKNLFFILLGIVMSIFLVGCNTNSYDNTDNTDTEEYSFTEQELYLLIEPLEVEFSDIDNDGDIDVVYSDDENDKLMLLRNNNGEFSNEVILDYYPGTGDVSRSYRLQDYNMDGYSDIIASIDTGLTICENDGLNSFVNNSVYDFTSASYLMDSFSNDFNGNNLMDIVSSVDYSVYYLATEGNHSITSESVIEIINYNKMIIEVESEDIDNDGDMDLLTKTMTYKDISIWFNDGAMNFTEYKIYSESESDASYPYANVNIVDIDDDGDFDLVGTEDEFPVWYEQLSDHSFKKNIISTEELSGNFCIIDFDDDGDKDVIYSGGWITDYNIILLENDGSEDFTRKILSENHQNGYAFLVVDYDGDCDNDILFIDPTSVYENPSFKSAYILLENMEF